MKFRGVAKCFLAIVLGISGLAPIVALGAAQDLPTMPDPVPVELDVATTAFLVLDINSAVCGPRPPCVASLPGIASLLDQARTAGAFVVYSQGTAPGATVLAEVAPWPDDPVVTGRADKFYGTDLEEILAGRGIRTVLVVGTAANGAVLYTSFAAHLRGYTVVVAEDGISAPADFATFLTRWQLLNQPGFDNPENKPLEPGRATLTRTDLVTFQ